MRICTDIFFSSGSDADGYKVGKDGVKKIFGVTEQNELKPSYFAVDFENGSRRCVYDVTEAFFSTDDGK